MTVRRLHNDEHPAWWAMRRKLFPDCDEEILTYEEARYDPAAGTEAVLVAEADGALVGFAEVAVRSRVDGATSDEVGYLEAWFVEVDWRGKGVGRALVAAAEAWARERGLTEMASDTELDNDRSIAAHRALGYRETYRIVQFIKPLAAEPPQP